MVGPEFANAATPRSPLISAAGQRPSCLDLSQLVSWLRRETPLGLGIPNVIVWDFQFGLGPHPDPDSRATPANNDVGPEAARCHVLLKAYIM